MSYCRWSSDGFGCDLYVYEDCYGGYTTHIASRRVIGDCPKLCWDDAATLKASYAAQREFLDSCEREDIGLPHDGESFNDSSLLDLYWRIVGLIELGYRVPHSVVVAIEEEMGEYNDECE